MFILLKHYKQIVLTYSAAFLNILTPKNQTLMKLYGIAAIPTQILLDKNGEEFFRHTGYISTSKLEEEIIQKD